MMEGIGARSYFDEFYEVISIRYFPFIIDFLSRFIRYYMRLLEQTGTS